MNDLDDIFSSKREMRRTSEAKRTAAFAAHPDAGRDLCGHFLDRISLPPKSVVTAYNKIGSEMDLAPLVDALRDRGHIVVFPVIVQKGGCLVFRRADKGDPFVKGQWGILEPSDKAQTLDPDIVLAPLLAFDRQGHRLGYGGGYYDRTLADLKTRRPVMAVGIAYACQEMPRIPTHSRDTRLDKIATEAGIIESA